MNLDRFDKIIIKSVEEVETLLAWRDLNKDLVREFKPTLHEGVIDFNDAMMTIYFKQTDKSVVEYKIWSGGILAASFSIKIVPNGYTFSSVGFSNPKGKELMEGYKEDCVTIHASLMAYMAYYERNVTSRKQSIKKVKKGKSGSNKPRAIRIGRVVYDVKVPAYVKTDKRSYTKAVDPFDVRGHYRHYKSGKVSWIASYVKGDKTKDIKPKTYKL